MTFNLRAAASSRISSTGTPYVNVTRKNGKGWMYVSSCTFCDKTSASGPVASKRNSAARVACASIRTFRLQDEVKAIEPARELYWGYCPHLARAAAPGAAWFGYHRA